MKIEQSGSKRFRWFIGAVIVAAMMGAVLSVWKMDPSGSKGSGLGAEYEYDLAPQRLVESGKILYRQTAFFSVDFRQARDIVAGDGGDLYLVGDRQLTVFSGVGDLKKTVLLRQEPLCVAFSEDRVYIGMKDHVQVFDSTLQEQNSFPPRQGGAVITALAVGGESVFAADAGNRVVWHLDPNGHVIKKIGQKDPGRNIPGFVIPSGYFDLAMGSDGLLRVVNPGKHQIEFYTTDGDLELAWGKPGVSVEAFCGCCNPIHIALLADDSVVTCEKGLTRVKVYDPQGKFMGVAAGADAFQEHDQLYNEISADNTAAGLNVATGPQGQIYVLDPVMGQVRMFEKLR